MGFYGNEALNENFFTDFIGDEEFFDMHIIDQRIRQSLNGVKEFEERSNILRKILFSLIVNVGNACRRQFTLKKLYVKNYRYNHIILVQCKKYINQLTDKDKRKLRGAIDKQFTTGLSTIPNPGKLWTTIPAKGIPQGAKLVKPLLGVPNKVTLGIDIANLGIDALKLVGNPIWRTIGEAMKFYKIESQGGNILTGLFTNKEQQKMYKYFFLLTSEVLEDIVKIYRLV